MHGDQLKYHLLLALIIMLLLLMMQLEKIGFIRFDKKMMFLTLLRYTKIWLRMRQKKVEFVEHITHTKRGGELVCGLF
jgi:hypothetical protein